MVTSKVFSFCLLYVTLPVLHKHYPNIAFSYHDDLAFTKNLLLVSIKIKLDESNKL